MDKKEKNNILEGLYVLFLIITAPIWIILELAKKA